MIARLHVVAAVAAVAAILTAVLAYPLFMALYMTALAVPYNASALDIIVPPLVFVLTGVPGLAAALIVRGLHPDGDSVRPWVVLLASAAGITMAIFFLSGGYGFVGGTSGTPRVSTAFGAARVFAEAFARVFYAHDFEQLLGIAAGAAAGAALGAMLSNAGPRKTSP